jgi:nitrite reductase (NO-forming)
LVIATALGVSVYAAGCAAPSQGGIAKAGGGPLAGAGLPALAGQAATCAGPRRKTFELEAREVTLDLGMGMRFNAWTYDGTLPGPALEACEGDEIAITVSNHATTSHGLDSHALRIDMRQFDAVPPGGTRVIRTTVDTPGVYMYHCASGPVTDIHIKNGLYGAMIVYPRHETLRPARELVVVQSGVFGAPDTSGVIPGTDPERARRNDPSLMLFNGRLEHAPLPVRPGDLVRAYVVNVGPGVSAIHVMGTLLDTVYDGASRIRDVQTYGVAPGSGAIIEFRIPDAGLYGLVDHDRLAYVPYGMVLTFDATGGRSAHSAHGADTGDR